ncbi:hypothetical protein TNCV_2105011 [Trichonephila clavipes]|nr:hypothetical protein TNCV_2105011 [Trichonephila clavipes]
MAFVHANHTFQMKVGPLVYKMFHGHSWSSTLVQETAMQTFIYYPDYLVRAAAPATVYRDSSIRLFEESYVPWNEVGQQMMQYADR